MLTTRTSCNIRYGSRILSRQIFKSSDGLPIEIFKRIRTENLSLILDVDIVGGVTEGEDHEFTNKYFPHTGDDTSANIQMTVADVDEDDDDYRP